MRHLLALLCGAAALLLPALAHAHSIGSGMGTVMVGVVLGVLTGLVLLVLIILSAVLGAKTDDRRPRRVSYGVAAMVVSIIACMVQISVVSLVAFFDLSQDNTGSQLLTGWLVMLLFFGLPHLVLTVASVLLARRVMRNHTER